MKWRKAFGLDSPPPRLNFGPEGATIHQGDLENYERKYGKIDGPVPDFVRVKGNPRRGFQMLDTQARGPDSLSWRADPATSGQIYGRPRLDRGRVEQGPAGPAFDPLVELVSQRAPSIGLKFGQAGPSHHSSRNPNDRPHSMQSRGSPGGFSWPDASRQPVKQSVSAHDSAGQVYDQQWLQQQRPHSERLHQSHHSQQPQQPQERVRIGKLPEGAPLPTGVKDPFATLSPTKPLGHYGQREHLQGMSKLKPEKFGPADDPSANWRAMQEFQKLQGERSREAATDDGMRRSGDKRHGYDERQDEVKRRESKGHSRRSKRGTNWQEPAM